MKYIHRFSFLIILAFLAKYSVVAQSYEDETGFTFVKAKYLLETNRYDDAVREFNRVIKDNPEMEDVLLLRGIAKYNLSAYIGSKKDALTYIELKGIETRAVTLLAKSEYHLGDFDAALNSLNTALKIVKDDPELYEYRAAILIDRDQMIGACEDYKAAAALGSSKASIAARNNCGITNTPPQREVVYERPINKPTNTQSNESENSGEVMSAQKEKDSPVSGSTNSNGEGDKPTENNENKSRNSSTDNDSQSGELEEDILEEFKEPTVDPRLLDESENEIVIDEDLTLVIKGQGLGSRPLLKQPNILILSDEEGEVVIDVCVSRGGRIVDTNFNSDASTIQRKSLVSLALRKSKDFWFEKSDLKEQCGRIIFKVSGT